MTADLERVKQWIQSMASLIAQNEDPSVQFYSYFLHEPELALVLIELLMSLDEKSTEDDQAYYSACIFALDVCIAQLHSAAENGNKHSARLMQQVMEQLTHSIRTVKRSLIFWLPIINAFYDVHVELSPELKAAYLGLVNQDDDIYSSDQVSHINSIRDLINELSDLSLFDMAENFFAQSYAMPAEFFSDLMIDLYSIDEGEEVGLLSLLHPEYEVREAVLATFEVLMPRITLSSRSLTRLQSIKAWYSVSRHEQFNRWVKLQRKKEVVFHQFEPAEIVSIKASEIDGGGAQGIFIHLKRGREHRLGGMLFKQGMGIKDAWITPVMKSKDVLEYHQDVFDESVMLREVGLEYLMTMANHFLALTISHGDIPNLHLLEIQEEMGVTFSPQSLEIADLIEQLSVQITPFTEQVMQTAVVRSKSWSKYKRFTESWYLENARIDTLVNQCCSYVDGVRVCRFEEAVSLVFKEEMENQRNRWMFHFVWVSLWLKSKSRKTETTWQDSFLIAYAIKEGRPLNEIPILYDICHHSVVNSIETMQERRTHLN